MRPALHALERALRELPSILRPIGDCCFLDLADEECPYHFNDEAATILELDPVYTTIEAVLEEAIAETRRRETAKKAQTIRSGGIL